jgi:general stress protein 26
MSNNRQVDFDGDAYFFTCDETRTVADIRCDPNVGLAYQAKSGMLGMRPFFLTIEGRAEIIVDKARFAEHWTKDLDRWFEDGIDTPGLTLIKVAAQRMHYWDGYDEGEVRVSGQAGDTGGTADIAAAAGGYQKVLDGDEDGLNASSAAGASI